MTKPKKYLITPSIGTLTVQVVKATMDAERDGRDFTPIFWYRTDDGVLHLTMWDMNEYPKERERVRHAWRVVV